MPRAEIEPGTGGSSGRDTNHLTTTPHNQCCGSKYIEFGSGSRIVAQFGSGSRSGSRSRAILSTLKEKIQNIFREKSTNYYLNKFLISWVWIVNKYLKSYLFCLHFILYMHVWIRKLLNTDPIRIRIHNTASHRPLHLTWRKKILPISLHLFRFFLKWMRIRIHSPG